MKTLKFLTVAGLAIALTTACSKDKLKVAEDTSNPEVEASGYYGFAQISVPAATKSVFVEYKSAGETKVTEVAVSPKVAEPQNGKNVEPFGTVSLLFQSSVPSQVSVYTQGNQKSESVYSLTDFPVNKVTSGEFGKTRYVQMAWEFAWYNDESTNYQNTHSNPDDVVFYDSTHNHTLRYIFCYSGPASEAYYLEDAYTISDRSVSGEKYNYCSGCGNCPKCMPWGCDCGCGKTNSGFTPSGDTTGGTGNITPQVPETVTTVKLSEPDSYVTTDEDQTFYHSSGVVMFDDSWPSKPAAGVGSIDADFNDVVVDYDIEAKTVSDELLESQGWREQVKVVLHLRAVGGDNPARVGLILEDFDQKYVDYIDQYVTLDSYQNEHGTLPSWVWTKIGQNCVHNEANTLRPYVEMAGIWNMKEAVAGETAGEYTYTNNGVSHTTVFNPGVKAYWPAPHTDQYEDGITKKAGKYYYNTTPGYVNVAGGLITYTVIYHMKARAEMTGEESQLCLKNMMDAVTKTTNQNFYIILTDWKPIGLKGYQPSDRDQSKYDSIVASNSAYLDADIPYYGNDGKVWAFKLPVLTKHVWEKYSFSLGYPQYESYLSSQGQDNVDWYLNPDPYYLTCWW